MRLKVVSIKNTVKTQKDLPKQFEEPIRPDLIKRAVIAIQMGSIQPYGADPKAGMKHANSLSRRRHKYKTTYGFGISRVPRKIMSSRGTRHNWVGAIAPGTVGGRRAHPPKAEKIWDKKINKQENQKAIRSSLAATISPTHVTARGHKIPTNYPFIIESEFEKITKTKEMKNVLKNLGFSEDLNRVKPKTRATRGTTRGRKKKYPISVLIVTGNECEAYKAADNIPGVQICSADMLNAELLAPGAVPGRMTLYTENAISQINDKKLFTKNRVTEKKEKKETKKEDKKTTSKADTKKEVKKKVATKKATDESKKKIDAKNKEMKDIEKKAQELVKQAAKGK